MNETVIEKFYFYRLKMSHQPYSPNFPQSSALLSYAAQDSGKASESRPMIPPDQSGYPGYPGPPPGYHVPPSGPSAPTGAPGFQPHVQPGYPQPGYPQPGFSQPGYPHPQPGYQQPGYNMGPIVQQPLPQGAPGKSISLHIFGT